MLFVKRNAVQLGRTALHFAASNGHGSTVKLLLRHGADVEAKDGHCPGPCSGRVG